MLQFKIKIIFNIKTMFNPALDSNHIRAFTVVKRTQLRMRA